jgi:hypothetical protein
MWGPGVNSDQTAGRDMLLKALVAAQRASIASPRGRATTQGEMNKLNRLNAEEGKARHALEAFDVARGLEPEASGQ